MAEHALQRMTVDEFLGWDDGSDLRHELADGVIRAMAPPSGPHRTMAFNAAGVIYNALREPTTVPRRNRSRHPHRRAYDVASRYRGHLPTDGTRSC